MRKFIMGLSAFGLIAGSAPTIAAPCRDAKGKFVKCTKAVPAKPEQALDEDAAGSRYGDLRLPGIAPRFQNDDGNRAAGLQLLARYLLFGRHHAFCFAQENLISFDNAQRKGIHQRIQRIYR